MTAITTITNAAELAFVTGDLSRLTSEQRTAYYGKVCESIGLNAISRPFDYIMLNGKLVLYALKSCTDQLRSLRGVSIEIVEKRIEEGVLTVTARASTPDGRRDEDIGAVPIANLKGEALANAHMKAMTKAKRRVTLSICGLGMLDESEIESIPGARVGEPTPPPVAQAVVEPSPANDAIVREWSSRFDGARTVEELTALRDECKRAVADQQALLEIGRAFATAQKAIKANGHAANG